MGWLEPEREKSSNILEYLLPEPLEAREEEEGIVIGASSSSPSIGAFCEMGYVGRES